MNDLSNEYNIVMSEIKSLTVAYNPNDFHYYNATFSDNSKVNTNDHYNDNNKCTTYMNIECNNDVYNCYNKEICKNRKYAMKIKDLQTFTKLLMDHKPILFNGLLIKSQNQIFITK
jgi:hypothetical protein